MPLYFYLSYARADSGPLVRKFSEHLSIAIRSRAGLPDNEEVGFFEDHSFSLESAWSLKAVEALRTSHTIVSLLSPAAFHTDRCGKEWQFFELRRNQWLAGAAASIHISPFVPVPWIPWTDSTPKIIEPRIKHYLDPTVSYGTRGLMRMFELGNKELDNYAKFVVALADDIVKTAEMAERLPRPLASLPPVSKVNSAFREHAEHGPFSQTTDMKVTDVELKNEQLPDETKSDDERGANEGFVGQQSHRMRTVEGNQIQQKFFVIDSRFFTTLVEKLHETADRMRPNWVSFSEPSRVEITVATQSKRTPYVAPVNADLEPYKFWVVEDNEQVLGVIRDTLEGEAFRARFFFTAEKAIEEIKKNPLNLPDLFLIGLGLKTGRMQGIMLIQEIAKLSTSTSIIATSGNPDNLFLAMKMGAVAVLSQPFSMLDEIGNMKHWAKVGRRQRLNLPDPLRGDRPVVLSYSRLDARVAMGLRSQIEYQQIGVWYDGHLERGKPWRPRIKSEIEKTPAFVALMTDNYLRSPECLVEWAGFVGRLEGNSSKWPLLLPVKIGKLTRKPHNIFDAMKEVQSVDLSQGDFWTELQRMVKTIKQAIRVPS